ncbi:serine/threonine-protein kinase phg2-like [Aphidius gifuensis]|uniref:serine/threonine-protein kinase phg2-like n=1 Tax=Aphidius gifuensis TaxID=684658 RepID=UPI001CDB8FC1|nr:serine/threonine-protein kinase phg2-like [Aphidius gifuensis]
MMDHQHQHTNSDSMLRDYERQSKMRRRQIELNFEMLCQSFASQIEESLSRLPHQIRQLTLNQLINQNCNSLDEMDDGFDEVSSSSSSATATATAATCNKVDYVDIQQNNNNNNNNNNICTSKNASRITRSFKQKINMKTPISSSSSLIFNNITPKIKPNTQLNMLRRPKEGEMVVSMQGSPILISGIVKAKTANINVPLGNGEMMSLMPHDGLRLSLVPHLDEETMKQLKTLKRHIESVIGNKS